MKYFNYDEHFVVRRVIVEEFAQGIFNIMVVQIYPVKVYYMVLLKDCLPPEVWLKIYELDPTGRTAFMEVLKEFKAIMAILSVVMLSFTPEHLSRRSKKKELVDLARFLHIKVDSSKTKHQLCILLHTYVCVLIPSIGALLASTLEGERKAEEDDLMIFEG